MASRDKCTSVTLQRGLRAPTREQLASQPPSRDAMATSARQNARVGELAGPTPPGVRRVRPRVSDRGEHGSASGLSVPAPMTRTCHPQPRPGFQGQRTVAGAKPARERLLDSSGF